ncbi:MAG: phosphoglucosamine mutase [Alphaproteobacteria bacterium]
MTRTLFGTDGVRGTANTEPMTAATALRVAMAAGMHFRRDGPHRLAVIGKDTRLSGYMLEPAMTAGFISMGMDVVLLGPLPTPAVAMLARSLRADLGVMISASHNPFQDNGIKLFGPDGGKLSDAIEGKIGALVENGVEDHLASPRDLGRARRLDDAQGRYIQFVKQTLPPGLSLNGLRIVIDCANGAAYRVGPSVLWELGADVIPLAVEPDGFNINARCGATDTERMVDQVRFHKADAGIALDGDADRIIMCDETGALLDGDKMLAVIAADWAASQRLATPSVVATVMSNLALERHLSGLGIRLDRAPVGDRYVLEQMAESGANLGGEQSGHLIMSDHATTGDGLIAGLQVLGVLVKSGKRLSEIGHPFTPLPQVLRSVRGDRAIARLDSASFRDSLAQAEASLAAAGRILVRKSGTEPVVRVMAEGEDQQRVVAIVDGLARALEAG